MEDGVGEGEEAKENTSVQLVICRQTRQIIQNVLIPTPVRVQCVQYHLYSCTTGSSPVQNLVLIN